MDLIIPEWVRVPPSVQTLAKIRYSEIEFQPSVESQTQTLEYEAGALLRLGTDGRMREVWRELY